MVDCAFGQDGLTVTLRRSKTDRDGAGTMVSVRAVDDHSLEETNSREGVVTCKTLISLSADGKTLTITSSSIEGGEPSVGVFEKR
jgi:hypothetical protein